MSFRKCNQKQCEYNKGNEGCPICPSCSAPSNEVDDSENCVDCWNCESNEGFIRGGIPDNLREGLKNALKKEQEEKLMVIENE